MSDTAGPGGARREPAPPCLAREPRTDDVGPVKRTALAQKRRSCRSVPILCGLARCEMLALLPCCPVALLPWCPGDLIKTMFPQLSALVIDDVAEGRVLRVQARTLLTAASCPQCGRSSDRVHVYHWRQLADLPVGV